MDLACYFGTHNCSGAGGAGGAGLDLSLRLESNLVPSVNLLEASLVRLAQREFKKCQLIVLGTLSSTEMSMSLLSIGNFAKTLCLLTRTIFQKGSSSVSHKFLQIWNSLAAGEIL